MDFNLIVEYKKGGKTTKIDKPLTREYDDCFEGTGGRAYTLGSGRKEFEKSIEIAIYEIELASRRFSAVGSSDLMIWITQSPGPRGRGAPRGDGGVLKKEIE